MPKGYIKSKNGELVEIVDAAARRDIKNRKEDLSTLERRLKSGAIADAELHLGFYIDENGDLCQKED